MTEIRFGGRCEKHLCPKPCTKCAEAGDSSTITVPRETWDAMISALENHPGNYKLTTLESRVYQTIITRAEALTATNAVSHPKTEAAPAPEGGAITSESAAAFYEQAFGVKLTDSAQIGGVLRLCNLAANAVTSECSKVTSEYSEQPQAQGEAAKKYAENLCISMARKFYPEVTQFEPLDDLFGLLTQIDNMTTGLVRPQATETAWRPIETAPANVEVIVAIEGGGVTIGSIMPTFGWAWYETDNEPDDAKVIGWQPLPAAPEAKQ